MLKLKQTVPATSVVELNINTLPCQVLAYFLVQYFTISNY